MARLPSYTKRNFTPAAQILAYDPSGQVTSLIPGQSLLDYIGLPEFNEALLNRVQWFSTNNVAKIEDLPLGRIIYTGGNTTIADGGGGHYVVVESGGSVVLDNGFELLLLPLGTVETGTGSEPVETALDNRWISKYTTDQLSTATSLRAGNLVRTPGYYAGWAATASGIPEGGNYGIVEERDGSAEDGGSIIFITGTTLQVRMIFPNGVNVKQFGARGDGSADDTSSIQKAIIYAEGASSYYTRAGVAVDIPYGQYRVSSLIRISKSYVSLRGDGSKQSVIYRDSGAGEILLVYTDSITKLSLQYSNVQGISFEFRGNATSGNLVEFRDVIDTRISDCTFLGWFNGLTLNGCVRLFMSDMDFSQAGRSLGRGASALTLTGNADLGNSADIHMINAQIRDGATGSPGYENSILIKGVDGFYVDNCHFYQADVTVNIDPDDTPRKDVIASLAFSNVYFDSLNTSSGLNHVRLQGEASVAYRDIKFSNCLFRDSTENSILSTSSSVVEIITFNGCVFRQNKKSAISIGDNHKDWVISGCVFDDNNKDNESISGDVSVSGDYVTIVGCNFKGGGTLGYGVMFASTSVRCLLSNSQFFDSSAADALIDNGAGNKVSKNIGITSESTGIAQITVGDTVKAVTHGLYKTPSISEISISLMDNSNFRGVSSWWINNATATSFDINVDAAVINAPLNFSWQAVIN